MLKKRTLAIAGSVAALSFAAAPIASAATASHSPVKGERVERTHDVRTDRTGHERSSDATRVDKSSRDTRSVDKSSRDKPSVDPRLDH